MIKSKRIKDKFAKINRFVITRVCNKKVSKVSADNRPKKSAGHVLMACVTVLLCSLILSSCGTSSSSSSAAASSSSAVGNSTSETKTVTADELISEADLSAKSASEIAAELLKIRRSDSFSKMKDSDRVDALTKILDKYVDEGLVMKDTTLYNEGSKMITFSYASGTLSSVSIEPDEG